jgi:hypothetical protein
MKRIKAVLNWKVPSWIAAFAISATVFTGIGWFFGSGPVNASTISSQGYIAAGGTLTAPVNRPCTAIVDGGAGTNTQVYSFAVPVGGPPQAGIAPVCTCIANGGATGTVYESSQTDGGNGGATVEVNCTTNANQGATQICALCL